MTAAGDQNGQSGPEPGQTQRSGIAQGKSGLPVTANLQGLSASFASGPIRDRRQRLGLA